MKNQEQMQKQEQELNDKNMDIIQQELGNLPLYDLPADFHNEMMAKVRMYAASRRAARRRHIFKRLGSLAAAAAVLVAAVMIFDAVPRQDRMYEGDAVAQTALDMPFAAGGAGADESDDVALPEFNTIWGVGLADGEMSGDDAVLDGMDFRLRGNLLTDFDENAESAESAIENSIEITIAVNDVQAALYTIQWLPGRLHSRHMYADYDDSSRIRAEVVMTLHLDDLEWVMAALHELGYVEHFAETAFDVQPPGLPVQEDAEATAAPVPATLTVIVITLTD